MKRLSMMIVFVFLCADLAMAQTTFFNSDQRSGQLTTPGVPGVHFYYDQERTGQIIETSPGVTFYHFTNNDGTGESGVAVDMMAKSPPLLDLVEP